MSRLLGMCIVLICFGAGLVWFNYGTLNACSIVRIKVREQDHDQGPSITALMPDAFLNGAIEAKYGRLSPSTCVKILYENEVNNTPVL